MNKRANLLDNWQFLTYILQWCLNLLQLRNSYWIGTIPNYTPNTFTNYKKSPIESLFGLNDWKNVKALPLEIHSNSLCHSIQNLTFKPPSSPGNMDCLASRFGSPLVRTDFTFVHSIVAMEMKEMYAMKFAKQWA